MKRHGKRKGHFCLLMCLIMTACGTGRQTADSESGVMIEITKPMPSGQELTMTPILSPTETSTPAQTETPTSAPTEAPTETPAPTPTEAPTETPTPVPTKMPAETPTPTPVEALSEGTDTEPSETKIVAFTFDDGPYTPVTGRITAVLSQYGASATFFVAGERLSTYKETLIATSDAGFEIGNHTWSHKDLNKLSSKKVQEEVKKTFDKIHEYISGTSVLVRPPYGNANKTVREAVDAPLINWSLDSEDWKSRDAETIIRRVLDTIKDGDIVLMHDLYPSTAEAVEYLVPELTARGYRIVSVSELYECKGKELKKHSIHRTTRE